MNARVARPSSLRLLFDGARRRENVFIRLRIENISVYFINRNRVQTHRNKNIAPKQTVPGIVRVIKAIMVEKNWPLVPGYRQFTTAKLFLDPIGRKKYAR